MAAGTAATAVGDALSAATDALAAAGVDTPRLDAEVLLAEASGRDRAALAADPDAAVDPAAGREFGAMMRRRIRREPVAYILGHKGFRRIELRVDPRALIPRPETELLVEVAVGLVADSVLDVGTGSGAIALAVADELPGARIVATDVSAPALEVAAANAGRLGFADRVELASGSLPPESDWPGADPGLLLANLPYVSEPEWERLPPEIREHEPRGALVAGPTGLETIESLVAAVGARSRPEAVALEVGAGQAGAVAELLRRSGFAVEVRRDLAGIERVVFGRR